MVGKKLITPAALQWSGDGQPYASDFSDCYFSVDNGLAETQHVFLAGNQLPERWTPTADSTTAAQDSFVIGETGFGTGLNFVAAWQLWQQNSLRPYKHLYFVSAELHPLRKDDLERAARLWPELHGFYTQLLEQYPPLTPGFHCLHFGDVTLLLLFGDATDMFGDWRRTDHPDFVTCNAKVDAWFLDGFAPAKNPTLWTDALIATLAQLSKPQCTLATFSAAGHLRRSLEQAGFVVHKQAGYGRKRDMVSASFTAAPPPAAPSLREQPAFVSSPYTAPWYLNQKYLNEEGIYRSNSTQQGNSVAIIGAGIAGCTLAHALACKGVQVTVFDAQEGPATQASGNLQAVLYSKFAASDDDFAQFNLATYIYALRYYRRLYQQQSTLPIQLCGVLQLAWNKEEQTLQNSLRKFFHQHPEFAQVLTRSEASALAGVEVESGGVLFPQAGWIQPAAVCRYLLSHPNINTIYQQRITRIDHEQGEWQLGDATHTLHRCAHLVIASGEQCRQFAQTEFLPLKLIRGQVSHATPTALSQQLNTVVCGDGYITPAYQGQQSFGATYTPKISDLAVTAEDHHINLVHLASSSAALRAQWQINQGISGGRAQIRTATPDYFPLCGPLPNVEMFLNRYAPLRKNARANIPHAGDYHPQLYVFAGLGSRGMSYAPLCAELLCQQIIHAPLPLPRHLVQQLNPARFMIRDLIKNRV